MVATALVTEAAVYAGGMSYLQFIWYKDHERVPFHFYNDNKGYLQIDKAGHAFGASMASMIYPQLIQRHTTGLSRLKAAFLSTLALRAS